MGNQASGTLGATGVGDVIKQYTVETEPVDASEEYGGFTLLRGKRKRDNTPVLLFRCDKTKTSSSGICSNALKQAKRLRHPLILNLLDGAETDTDIFMVTEEATPLAACFNSVKQESQRAWGIRCIANVLSFLNEKCRLVHGNVTPWTLFVTPGGDWKLFGLELLDMECTAPDMNLGSVVMPPLLKQAQWIPSSHYKAPERRKNDFKSMDNGALWSLDSWALGNVIIDVYEGSARSATAQPRLDPPADADRLLPPTLRASVRQLLASDPRSRLSPSAFSKSEYFSDIFVRSMIFLEELPLKAPEKREAFFKSLVANAPNFPPGALQFKLIPLVAQAISFESKSVNAANMAAASGQPPPTPTSVNVLLGMLDCILVAEGAAKSAAKGGHELSEQQKARTVGLIDTAVADLFACNDRIVRVGLLQRIEKMVAATSAEAINNAFDQIGTGFSDATPVVRELTIKAMVLLVPRLNDLNKNDKLMRYLAKLQNDPEHAIRTNCVVCLGLIAPQLSADARRKTLTASFARAMKDPFVHARVAGLRGLISAHKLMGLDTETLAAKILPTVCPLLVDPAKEVRVIAMEAMNTLLKTLQEDLKAAELAQVTAPAVTNPTAEKAQTSSEGFLGMAVSFATSFTTSKSTAAATNTGPGIQQTVAPFPVATVYAQPAKSTVSWEEDEDTSGSLMMKEEDPDDFFSKPMQPQKKQSETLIKTPALAAGPVVDIFANEEKAIKPKSLRLGKKVSADKRAVPLDLLSDEDFFGAKPLTPTMPVASSAPAPFQPKSSSTADDDFFSALLTAPPKRKT